MKKNALFVLGVLVFLLCFSGCSPSNKNKTMGDLVEHFRENGIVGFYEPSVLYKYGAVEAGYYSNQPSFYSRLYKFDEIKKVESFAKLGGQFPRFVNGYFVMECTYESMDLLLPVFNSF